MSKITCVLTCAALGLACLAAPARAVVAPSRGRVETREKGLRRVRELLDREAVRRRLARMGMSRGEIEERLGRLDEAEIERLAGRLESLDAGRSALGVAVAVLVIAVLILLIIWLAERL